MIRTLAPWLVVLVFVAALMILDGVIGGGLPR